MAELVLNLTIGGVAKATGVGVEAIRYYQRRGLLAEPTRHEGRVRRYGPRDVERLRFVKAAQKVGFSLEEIGTLLRLDDGTGCDQARELAAHKLEDVHARLESLNRLERVLTELVERCESNQGQLACPLIQALGATGSAPSAGRPRRRA
ncbi:MAG: Hg(II)-responsive transcriptional regulator [Proteobacteria bacterium]|nr:Hg(II)-responsive transcriptional regulator [Pseudomonadota bacterium]